MDGSTTATDASIPELGDFDAFDAPRTTVDMPDMDVYVVLAALGESARSRRGDGKHASAARFDRVADDLRAALGDR